MGVVAKTTTGEVFSIERSSMNDGPGIRTTVFLKGCPLRCAWCHNPESQSRRAELLFNAERCVSCGACVEACPRACHRMDGGAHAIDRASCDACGACVAACPNGALQIKGERMAVEEILDVVGRDARYYERSGGGVTLSGGEPLMQPEFSHALLDGAKRRGIHTCVETCGFAPREALAFVASRTDLFLFDCKETSDERHREYTGAGLGIIRENLKYLDDGGIPVVLRCPIVPGYNDRDEHLRGIADLVNSLTCIRYVEVMPYHPMGTSKSVQLGRPPQLAHVGFVDEVRADEWRATIGGATGVEVR